MSRKPVLAALVSPLLLCACAPEEDRTAETGNTPGGVTSAPPMNAGDGGTGNEAVASEARGTLRASQFTALDGKACKPPRTIEETGDWDRDCPGIRGYALTWSSGDLREDLAIRRAGKETRLNLPILAASGAFDSLGKSVEWRGHTGQAPDVLVVRVHVANDQGENDGGHLAVARLGDAPCVVGLVPPSSGQSAKARAIADGPLPACLKGQAD